MNRSYRFGWSYARQTARRAPGRKNVRASARKPRGRIRLNTRLRSAPVSPGGMLGRPGRVLVAGLLLGITFLVLAKDPELRRELMKPLSILRKVSPENKVAEAGPAPRVNPAPPAADASKTEPPAAEKPENPVSRALPPIVPRVLLVDQGLYAWGKSGEIRPWEGGQSADLPIVTGVRVWRESSSPEKRLATDLPAEWVEKVLAAPWAERISELHFGPETELVLYTREGCKILLPRDGGTDRALRRLTAIFDDLGARHQSAGLIDLRYRQHAVVRPTTGR